MSYDLNLGPFNSSIDIINDPNGEIEYRSDPCGNKMVYYESDDVVSEMAVTRDAVTIPTFGLEDSISLAEKDYGVLVNKFEFKIINMIYHLGRFSKMHSEYLDTAKIVIPIQRPLEIYKRSDAVCGHMRLGLALFTYNVDIDSFPTWPTLVNIFDFLDDGAVDIADLREVFTIAVGELGSLGPGKRQLEVLNSIHKVFGIKEMKMEKFWGPDTDRWPTV